MRKLNNLNKFYVTYFFKALRKATFLTILLFSFIFSSAYSFASCSFSDLKNSVLRLHVIANSDSDEDQSLKLKVRDNILSYINDLSFSSREECIKYCKNHIQVLKDLSLRTIHDNGYDYDVNVEIGDFYFPTKTYGDISFPSGFYEALKIEIGNARGHNWWCVMFPPLCFVDVSSGIVPDDSKKILEDMLSSEDYNLITSGNNLKNSSNNNSISMDSSCDNANSKETLEGLDNAFTFKFKIIELINNFSSRVAKNN